MTDVGFGGGERMNREGNQEGAEVQCDAAEIESNGTIERAENETRFAHSQRIQRKPARSRDDNFV